MKVAALDLGTNTFLCLICEVERGQMTRIYYDQVEMVRLGQGVQASKKFHPEALQRAEKALTLFKKVIDQHHPERILAMATSAARDVTNAEALFEIGKKLKIPIQIIPGGQEAQITFQGAVSAFASTPTRRLIVDVGGGSTEFIYGSGHAMAWGQSLNIGCVRLKEKYIKMFPVTHGEIEDITMQVRKELDALKRYAEFASPQQIDEVLAVAGTPTELARIEVGAFIAEKIDGYRITTKKLEDWIHQLGLRTPEQIVKDYGVAPGRADVLLIGVIILLETLRAVQKSELVVSIRGVRYGVALEVAK